MIEGRMRDASELARRLSASGCFGGGITCVLYTTNIQCRENGLSINDRNDDFFDQLSTYTRVRYVYECPIIRPQTSTLIHPQQEFNCRAHGKVLYRPPVLKLKTNDKS